MRSDRVFENFIQSTGIDAELKILPTDFDCLKELIETHDTHCGKFDDYSLKYVKHIVQACETSNLLKDNLVSLMITSCGV